MLLTLLLIWSLYPCRMSIVNCFLWEEVRRTVQRKWLACPRPQLAEMIFPSCSSWSPGSVDLSTLPHNCPPLWLELGSNGPLQEAFRMLGVGLVAVRVSSLQTSGRCFCWRGHAQILSTKTWTSSVPCKTLFSIWGDEKWPQKAITINDNYS